MIALSKRFGNSRRLEKFIFWNSYQPVNVNVEASGARYRSTASGPTD